MESATAPPPEGTQIDPVDANGQAEDHNLGLAVIAADLATAAPGASAPARITTMRSRRVEGLSDCAYWSACRMSHVCLASLRGAARRAPCVPLRLSAALTLGAAEPP
jgi:hypothetical protein